MTIKLGSNIASTQAQRRLGDATTLLSKIYERLSSGQRINTSSDDAAGLAISEDLNAKSRIFAQGLRNINDGVSVHAIADATVEALSGIATRLQELAAQSANGSYSNTQRKALDAEAQALAKEYFRVSRSAQFNGLRLFDGSMADGLRIQAGIGLEGSILTRIGGSLGDGDFSILNTYETETGYTNKVQLSDLNGDGILDLVTAGESDATDGYVTVRLGAGNGTFGSSSSYTTETYSSYDLALGDVNGDGIIDLVTAGYSPPGGGVATIRLGYGDGSFGAATSYTTESGQSNAISLGDLNGDGILDMITGGRGGWHRWVCHRTTWDRSRFVWQCCILYNRK